MEGTAFVAGTAGGPVASPFGRGGCCSLVVAMADSIVIYCIDQYDAIRLLDSSSPHALIFR